MEKRLCTVYICLQRYRYVFFPFRYHLLIFIAVFFISIESKLKKKNPKTRKHPKNENLPLEIQTFISLSFKVAKY